MDVILLCCEFGHLKSFDDIRQFWWNEVLNNADKDSQKVIVVNKVDLKQKELDLTEVKRWCDSKQINFYIVSAKTGEGVNDMFKDLIANVVKKKKKEGGGNNPNTNQNIGGYRGFDDGSDFYSNGLGSGNHDIARLSYNMKVDQEEDNNCCN